MAKILLMPLFMRGMLKLTIKPITMLNESCEPLGKTSIVPSRLRAWREGKKRKDRAAGDGLASVHVPASSFCKGGEEAPRSTEIAQRARYVLACGHFRSPGNQAKILIYMVSPAGIEPATH